MYDNNYNDVDDDDDDDRDDDDFYVVSICKILHRHWNTSEKPCNDVYCCFKLLMHKRPPKLSTSHFVQSLHVLKTVLSYALVLGVKGCIRPVKHVEVRKGSTLGSDVTWSESKETVS